MVTFLGYITYKYFLKTTVELKPRQRVLCMVLAGDGLRAQEQVRGDEEEELPSPSSHCVWQRWRGVPVATWPGELLLLKHGSQKPPPKPSLTWKPRLYLAMRRAPCKHHLCGCLSVRGVCVLCPWARSCSWPLQSVPVPGIQF